MATIVLSDDGIRFDGLSPDAGPLGGAETAFVCLAEALAARGHRVWARARGAACGLHRGVAWEPLEAAGPGRPDLHIANRSPALLDRIPDARRRVLWLHNPAGYLRKWRHLRALWRQRPALVFLGPCHRASCPRWVFGIERQVIPLAVHPAFSGPLQARAAAPAPVAVFLSSPLRGLETLLALWAERIRPALPAAELHLYAGPAVYGDLGAAKRPQMEAALDRAAALAAAGVVCHPPVAKAALAQALAQARVALHPGDRGETFCLAIAEAQAMGVPAVVGPQGAVAERVIDRVTGYVAGDRASFATATLRLLGDDRLWQAHHEAALRLQRRIAWDRAAAAFEGLLA